jgi:hypothetical protein
VTRSCVLGVAAEDFWMAVNDRHGLGHGRGSSKRSPHLSGDTATGASTRKSVATPTGNDATRGGDAMCDALEEPFPSGNETLPRFAGAFPRPSSAFPAFDAVAKAFHAAKRRGMRCSPREMTRQGSKSRHSPSCSRHFGGASRHSLGGTAGESLVARLADERSRHSPRGMPRAPLLLGDRPPARRRTGYVSPEKRAKLARSIRCTPSRSSGIRLAGGLLLVGERC